MSPYVVVSPVNDLMVHVDFSMRDMCTIVSARQMDCVGNLLCCITKMFGVSMGIGGVGLPFSLLSEKLVVKIVGERFFGEDDRSEVVAAFFDDKNIGCTKVN